MPIKAAPDMSRLEDHLQRLENEHPVKKARLKLGLSLVELGRITGLHDVTIGGHEHGQPIGADAAARYHAVLGIPLNELITINVEQTPLRVE